VRCPHCAVDDDRVVDSRLAEDGASIRRRRECSGCGRRYTTFERIEEAALLVQKRSGEREPFDRDKIASGFRAACKNRPVTEASLDAAVAAVEETMRLLGRDVTSDEIGVAALEELRHLDDVGYVRFASVYKGFEHPDDFAREARLLVKTTEPKRKS
jgi:transcriptional repressor NrdR